MIIKPSKTIFYLNSITIYKYNLSISTSIWNNIEIYFPDEMKIKKIIMVKNDKIYVKFSNYDLKKKKTTNKNSNNNFNRCLIISPLLELENIEFYIFTTNFYTGSNKSDIHIIS